MWHGKPLDPSFGEEFTPLQLGSEGIFGGNEGSEFKCLRLNQFHKLELNPDDHKGCTTRNLFGPVWKFKQKSSGEIQLCMQAMAIPCQQHVLEQGQFPPAVEFGESGQSCGKGWTASMFGTSVLKT